MTWKVELKDKYINKTIETTSRIGMLFLPREHEYIEVELPHGNGVHTLIVDRVHRDYTKQLVTLYVRDP